MSNPEQRAIDAAIEFSNAVNEMSFDAEAFAKTIRRDHRTSQENTGRVIIELLSQWSKDFETGNFDLRNQDIVEFANKAVGEEKPFLRSI